MKLRLALFALASCLAAGCDDGCAKDTDCKGERICVRNRCVTTAQPDLASSPSPDLAPSASPDLATGGSPHDLAGLDFSLADLSTPLDLSVPLDLSSPPDLASSADLTSAPSESDCFQNWRTLGSACPPPAVTASYYTGSQCSGTAGWVFEGHYFQFDQPDPSQPVLSWGPTDHGSSAYGGRNLWNRLSSTYACITICVGCGGTIIGSDVWLTNPDGQSSNHVTAGSKP